MQRISISEAARDLSGLVRTVVSQGTRIELTEGSTVVAYMTPPDAEVECSVEGLQNLIRELPDLDDDAAAFAKDVAAVDHCLPDEVSAWD